MEYSALNRNTSTNYSMHTIESGTQITEETMDKPLPLNPPLPNDAHVNAKALRLGILFVAANLTTLILTIIPVVFKNLPDFDLGPNRVGWFGVGDIIRFLEPVLSLPFQLAIFLESDIFSYSIETGYKRETLVLCVIFALSAAIYQQGAGYHSSANMFKHALATLRKEQPGETVDDIHTWMRDTWEHLISHYIYAIGGILHSFLFSYCFRNFTSVPGTFKISVRLVWLANSVLYGLIVGAIATQYPSGPIVALLLIVCFGYGVLGSFLYLKKRLFKFGQCIVLQSYLLAYTLGLCIVIPWVVLKGFKGRNED